MTPRPLRILLLTPLWSPDGASPSGIANHFYCLARGLRENGHSVTVLWLPDLHHFPCQDHAPTGVAVHKCEVSIPLLIRSSWLARRLGWQLAALPIAVYAVFRQLGKQPCDVIETTSFSALGWWLEKMPGSPPCFTRISTTIDQLTTHHTSSYSRALLLTAAIENACIRQAYAPLTHTRRHREELQSILGIDTRRVALVPHGIDPPPTMQHPPPHLPGEPALLFIGNLGHRKGADILLIAAPVFLKALPTAVLHLAGSTEGNDSLKPILAALQNAFPGRLIVHGKVDVKTRENLYGGSDLVLMPSRYESFGFPLVEAMRHGRPIVASCAGGIPEVVGTEAGVLVPPADGPALAAAIISLCTTPGELARRGAAARERFKSLFTTRSLAAASTALYRARIRFDAGTVI